MEVRIRNVDEKIVREIDRSEEHTSELLSLARISYAVFCLKKKKKNHSSIPRAIGRGTESSVSVLKTVGGVHAIGRMSTSMGRAG